MNSIFFIVFSYINNKIIFQNCFNIRNGIRCKMASEFISDPDYKKIIKTRNLLNYKETFNTVSNIGVPLNDVVKSENNDNFITINQELSDNYSKKYRKRDILHNEYKFVRNNITKVYINIEQIFDDLNIYHIGVTFKSIIRKISFDIIGIRLYDTGFMRNKNRLKKTLFWDYSSKTIDEVIEYEKNLKYRYIIGIYDCRHYVRNLTAWACNNPTPVWKLDRLVKK